MDLRLLCAGVVLLMAVGCGQSQDYSSVKHNLDEPIRNTSSVNWHKISNLRENTIFEAILSVLSDGSRPLLKSSPVHKRMSYWVELMDRKVRELYPEQFVNVPVPEVVVMNDNSPNAFVAGIPVCYDIPIHWGISSGELMEAAFVNFDGKIIDAGGIGQLCIPKEITSDQILQELVEMFNNNTTECRFSITEEKDKSVMVTNGKCDVESTIKDNFGASKIVLLTAANRVVINKGLIAEFKDEFNVLSVIAHELGHYYRGHLTASNKSEDYNFFYETGVTNSDRRPVPDPRYEALGRELINLDVPFARVTRVEGQKYRSEFFLALLGIVNVVNKDKTCRQGDEDCNIECGELLTWLNTGDNVRFFGGFPAPTRLGDRGRAKYLEFEGKVEACFADVTIGEEGIEFGRSISAETLRSIVKSNVNRVLRDNFSWDGFEPEGTIAASIGVAENILDAYYVELIAPLTQARDIPLGYYTQEQEADELSMEIMNKLGVEPRYVVETYLELAGLEEGFYREFGIDLYPYAVGFTTCKELYQNGWKDSQGNIVMILPAKYIGSYHSTCYRAFNMDREIRAHRYNLNPELTVTVPTDYSWAEIQRLASR
jgi:hypothetical protein